LVLDRCNLGYGESFDTNMRDAAFTYSNAVIENGVLYADIEILETMMGDEVKRILELGPTETVFRPKGTGTFEGSIPEETKNLLNVPNRVSMDYQILGMAAIDKLDDSFNIEEDGQ